MSFGAAAQKPSPFPEKNQRRYRDAAPVAEGAPTLPDKEPETVPELQKAGTALPASNAVVASGQATTGRATYFGNETSGRRGAGLETIDTNDLIAGHPSLPIGTLLRVTNLGNGKSVVVRVSDRCSPRLAVTVSRKAAEALDFVRSGSAQVRVEPVKPKT